MNLARINNAVFWIVAHHHGAHDVRRRISIPFLDLAFHLQGGLESLEVVGSEARFVLLDACEHLTFYPRFSREIVTYDYIGGMMSFGETFGSRIGRWIEQNLHPFLKISW